MFEDTTILLQGLLHDEVPLDELLEKYSKISPHIIITIYDYQEEKARSFLKNFPTVKVLINNEKPFIDELTRRNIPEKTKTDGYYHCYFQMRCIMNALPEVKTPYLLFCRIDHNYSNLESFITVGKTEKKFVSSSFIVRGLDIPSWKVHFSDCLFFGETDEIRLVFAKADRDYQIANLHYKPPETRIWRPYFTDKLKEEGVDVNICSNDDFVKHFSKYIYIMPLHNLGPFKIKAMNRIWRDDDLRREIQTTEHYLRHGMGFWK